MSSQQTTSTKTTTTTRATGTATREGLLPNDNTATTTESCEPTNLTALAAQIRERTWKERLLIQPRLLADLESTKRSQTAIRQAMDFYTRRGKHLQEEWLDNIKKHTAKS